jgi:tRNA (guanine-N7-)-methyltransferase
MATTCLKLPFEWNQRRVLIEDRIFYAPSRYEGQTFTFPGWKASELFGNDQPLCIEYCSGNGAWIADQAAAYPQFNWVAVEMKWARVSKIWENLKRRQLPNLVIVYGEGQEATRSYFPSACMDKAFINFPDPWPKKRHAKHRLINPSFVAELARLLKPGSILTMVTDDLPYSTNIIETLQTEPLFSNCHSDPFFITELPGYGSSFFEEFWRRRGKEIRYHQYVRKKDPLHE